MSLIGVLSEYNEGNKFFFVTLAKFNGHEINLIKVSLEYGIETHGNLIVKSSEELHDTNYEQTQEEMKNTINAPYQGRFAVFAVTAVFAFVSALCGLRIPAAAVNGITLSDDTLSRGDTFTVSVTVPVAQTNADSA